LSHQNKKDLSFLSQIKVLVLLYLLAFLLPFFFQESAVMQTSLFLESGRKSFPASHGFGRRKDRTSHLEWK
jgi:hypothetical protein